MDSVLKEFAFSAKQVLPKQQNKNKKNKKTNKQTKTNAQTNEKTNKQTNNNKKDLVQQSGRYKYKLKIYQYVLKCSFEILTLKSLSMVSLVTDSVTGCTQQLTTRVIAHPCCTHRTCIGHQSCYGRVARRGKLMKRPRVCHTWRRFATLHFRSLSLRMAVGS